MNLDFPLKICSNIYLENISTENATKEQNDYNILKQVNFVKTQFWYSTLENNIKRYTFY